MLELGVVLVAMAGVGWVRPRWSTLALAGVPSSASFVLLLLHEDIPGRGLTAADLAWYLAMSFVVAVGAACVIAAGIAGRRSLTSGNGVPVGIE